MTLDWHPLVTLVVNQDICQELMFFKIMQRMQNEHDVGIHKEHRSSQIMFQCASYSFKVRAII